MIAIKNAKIMPMVGPTIDQGFILIDQTRIVQVGSMAEYTDDSALTETFDAKGGYVLPGFIDAHCHVGMWEDGTSWEGADGNEATEPITPQLKAIDGVFYKDRSFEEACEYGVTTVVTGPGSANVIGGQFAALKTTGEDLLDMVIQERVAMKMAFGENPKRVYGTKNKLPSTRMGTAAILRENLYKAQNYLKKKENAKSDKEAKEPDFDFKMESLTDVLSGDLLVKAHAHRQDDIMTAIRIAREFGLRITIEHATEGHLVTDALRRENIGVIAGPIICERAKVEMKNLSPKAPGIMARAGIKTAIMTDHPVIPIQYLPLCAAVAHKEGMDEDDALKSITLYAAQLCGIDDRVGSLAKDRDADILVFDGHPFSYRTKLKMVMVNGAIIHER